MSKRFTKRWLMNNFRTSYNNITNSNVLSCIFTQTRDYAARKGTREKARKKKVKVVIQKVGFIPHNQRLKKVEEKNKISPIHMIDDSRKSKPIDNVWVMKYYKQPVYSLKEAIQFHRETHHPTMYNKPNSYVNAIIDLNMQREKKTKFFDKFSRIIDTPHVFESGINRSVLAFCKTVEDHKAAEEAGATYVGGTEIIKQIQAGEFPYRDYNHIVAHVNILPDLLLIRGLLKKRFPNARSGNLGHDIRSLVTKFTKGIEYTAVPFDGFKEFGNIDVCFGTLNMDTKQLEENFSAIINDLEKVKPKRDASFILRVRITSLPSPEHFKVNFAEYLPGKLTEEVDEEDETSAVIATN